MQPDLEGLADVIVLTVENALSPVLERLATAEQCTKDLQARVNELLALRDRVVVVETKTAAPAPSAPDLTPVLERLADLRDRVVTVETKVATPVLPLPPDAGVSDLRDRLVTLETKAAMPVPTVLDTPMVDLRERVASLERRVQDDSLAKELGSLRERVAVVETRAPIPGPAGVNGKDGADGMGWDDLSVEHDGERAFTVKMRRGDRVKDAGTFTVPVQIYRGVYTAGRTYEAGDTVTYARSLWHCRKATTLKPDSSTRNPLTGEADGAQGKDFWQLVAKGGTDGKDGRDAPGALPVVSVGRTQ